MEHKTGQCGRQSWYAEGDLVCSRWVGACSMEELQQFLAFAEVAIAAIAHPFLLIDNTLAKPARPEVRRYLLEWARVHRLSGGVVVFGADLPTRTIGLLLVNAIGLMMHSNLGQRVAFVRDEAAARAWIDARRRGMRGG